MRNNKCKTMRMTRKQEEIVSLTIVGLLILLGYILVAYVLHTQLKKQPIEKKVVHSTKIGTDWNLTEELEPSQILYYESLVK